MLLRASSLRFTVTGLLKCFSAEAMTLVLVPSPTVKANQRAFLGSWPQLQRFYIVIVWGFCRRYIKGKLLYCQSKHTGTGSCMDMGV